MLNNLISDMEKLRNPKKAKILARFFKTGKGEYGEGDVFLGIQVPDTRKVAKNYLELDDQEIRELLDSKIHEHRLAALLLLVEKYKKSDEKRKKKIVDFYLTNTDRINNWDLVDLSADKILGDYLFDKDDREKSILYTLARSKNLWERRIAIISTFAFIKQEKFEETFKVAEILLQDKHDLIHKAVGWMLREIGKRNQEEEEKFLRKHYKRMPRTMLRYAIERFDDKKRKFYLS